MQSPNKNKEEKFLIVMKVPGIDGECKQPGHEGWVVLDSIQFGVGRGISSGRGYGEAEDEEGSADEKKRQTSSVSVSEVTFTTHGGYSCVANFREAFQESHWEVTIRVLDQNQNHKIKLEMVLQKVLISGYSLSMGDTSISESISFNYTSIALSSPDRGLRAAYDIESQTVSG
jgi:type VI secretion system secreted protein Hcp